MTAMKNANIAKPTQDRLLSKHPLVLTYKRGKVRREHLDRVVIARGSPFGAFALNWIGAGKFASTLQAVLVSDEPRFVEAREVLRELKIRMRPRPVHFAILGLVEANFPKTITRADIAEELELTRAEVERAVRYLRTMIVVLSGVNILCDGKGGVGVADADLWITHNNRQSKMKAGIDRNQRRHGLDFETLSKHNITVQRDILIQPALILERAEGEGEA